jgi:hypothetical protein
MITVRVADLNFVAFLAILFEPLSAVSEYVRSREANEPYSFWPDDYDFTLPDHWINALGMSSRSDDTLS